MVILPALDPMGRLVKLVKDILEIRKLRAEGISHSINDIRQLQQTEKRLINTIPEPYIDLKELLEVNKGYQPALLLQAQTIISLANDRREAYNIAREVPGTRVVADTLLEYDGLGLRRIHHHMEITTPSSISPGSNIRTYTKRYKY